MMTLEIKGLQRLAKKLDPVERDKALKLGMTHSGYLLQNWIVRNRLSGPRPRILDRVTGRLANSITTSKTIKEGTAYITKIGTNVEYARIHEFGYDDPDEGFTVIGGHLRRDKSKDEYIKTYVGGKLKRTRVVTGFTGVGQHIRAIRMPARPFMRPAFENEQNQREILAMITEKLQEALDKEQ
jgi:HK97 gp10 family phage protein